MEQSRQLHVDGRTAAARLTVDQKVAQGARERREVDRAVTVEARIFGCDHGMQKVGRNAVERNGDGVPRVGREDGPEREAGAIGKRHGLVLRPEPPRRRCRRRRRPPLRRREAARGARAQRLSRISFECTTPSRTLAAPERTSVAFIAASSARYAGCMRRCSVLDATVAAGETGRGRGASKTGPAAVDRLRLALRRERAIAGADPRHLRQAGDEDRGALRRRAARRARSRAHRAGAQRPLQRAHAPHDRVRRRTGVADRHPRARHPDRRITEPRRRRASQRLGVDV